MSRVGFRHKPPDMCVKSKPPDMGVKGRFQLAQCVQQYIYSVIITI